MIDLNALQPEPSKFKSILLKKHGLKLSQITNYLGCSYVHGSRLLNGVAPMTAATELKLQALVDQLESQTSNSN